MINKNEIKKKKKEKWLKSLNDELKRNIYLKSMKIHDAYEA